MEKCSHKKPTLFKEKRERWCSIIEDWEEVVYEEWIEVSAFEDIDTHRMKCSRCGEIHYYSQSARNHYENGIPSPWIR